MNIIFVNRDLKTNLLLTMIKIYKQRSQLHTTFSFNFRPFVWSQTENGRSTIPMRRRIRCKADFNLLPRIAMVRCLRRSHSLTFSAFTECDSAVWMPWLPSLHLAPQLLTVCLAVIDSRGWRLLSASSALAILQTILGERGLICRNYYDSSDGLRHNF